MLIILILFINLFELYIILKKYNFNNIFLINYLVNINKILARDSSSDGRALA